MDSVEQRDGVNHHPSLSPPRIRERSNSTVSYDDVGGTGSHPMKEISVNDYDHDTIDSASIDNNNNRPVNVVTVLGEDDILELPLPPTHDDDHDQLPNIEDYKAQMNHKNHSSSPKSTLKSLFCSRTSLGIILCCTMACMISLIIGVLVGEEAAAANITTYTYGDVSNSDDGGSSISNTMGMTEDQIRFETAVNTILNMDWAGSTGIDDIMTPSLFQYDSTNTSPENIPSPQYMAVKWLAVDDRARIPVDVASIQFIQRYVLAVLYYSTEGPNWTKQYHFLSASPVCLWNEYWESPEQVPTTITTSSNYDHYNDGDSNNDSANGYGIVTVMEFHQVGIICDDTVPTIQRIYLPSNQLKGTLPIELILLQASLQEFNVYQNEISGTIPVVYNELKQLRALVVHSNFIQDIFPVWVDQLRYLQVLNMGNNEFTGLVPTELSDSIQVFNCDNCNLQGTIDGFLGLRNLQSIHVRNNQLQGKLVDELTETWESIVELDISHNLFQGTLPITLLQSSTLEVLDVADNSFTGPIPVADMISSKLKYMALQQNGFTGSLNNWMEAVSNEIEHLDISMNKFTGTIPTEVGMLNKLKYLSMASNPKLQVSTIPTEMGQLKQLTHLSLQDTNRNGTIPYTLKEITALVLLDLNQNQLTGQIPDELATMKVLKVLMLSHNELEGDIPESFIMMDELQTILLNDNKDINSGTRIICDPDFVTQLTTFTADCQPFTTGMNNAVSKTDATNFCPCCTTCCDSATTTGTDGMTPTTTTGGSETLACNAQVYYSDLDPTSNYHIVRQFFQLHEEETQPVLENPNPYGINDINDWENHFESYNEEDSEEEERYAQDDGINDNNNEMDGTFMNNDYNDEAPNLDPIVVPDTTSGGENNNDNAVWEEYYEETVNQNMNGGN